MSTNKKFKTLDGFNSTGDVVVGANTLTVDTSSERVGIKKGNPQHPLDINGTVAATLFSGSGASLTNVEAATLAGSANYLRSDVATTYTGSGNFTFNSTGTLRIQAGQIRLDNDRLLRFGTVNSPGVSMRFNSANNTMIVEGSNTTFIGNGGTFFRRGENQHGLRLFANSAANTNTLSITSEALSSNATVVFQGSSGTVALLSDLPVVGNGTLTISGSNGLSGDGTFTANQSANTSVTLTNTDRGSDQNIFKQIGNANGDQQFVANTNNDMLLFEGTGAASVSFDDETKKVVIDSTNFSEISAGDIANTTNETVGLITGRRFQAGLSTNRSITGSWTFSGTVSAADLNSTSDRSLKENIEPIDDALSKVLALQGVSFDWKDSGEKSIGLIAQDVEKVIPEVVSDDGEIKRISYGNLVGLLIEAVKDQQKEIESLKQIINNK